MPTTEFPLNHPLAVRIWTKALMAQTINDTWFERFVGDSQNSLIYRKTELEKGAGSRITYGLKRLMVGDGKEGDAILEGYEEELNFFSDDIYINQLRHATRSAGKMSEQRVPFKLRQEGTDSLATWWADRKEISLFNHLCGNTAQSDTRYTGHNSVTAIDANHIIADSDRTIGDQSLSTSANNFDLKLIDACVQRAKTLRFLSSTESNIRPLRIDGKPKYVMFLHPAQVRDMRNRTDSGQWLDITKAVYQGSKMDNPIYDGALGEYNGVILHESVHVQKGINSTTGLSVDNTRRAVFCGAQAACLAYGGDGGSSIANYFEELFDYGNQLGIAAGLIWGVKAATFNSTQSHGRIVVPTYAADTATI
ncbi:MAG TPA: N4-gp56 family major capsid protein [Accumulibacter sp.]|nr:N4-gp56 family major capsid protein [Accumulibacter sp.]